MPIDMPIGTPSQAFTPVEREAVYRAIYERRDMRHFAGGTVAPEVMRRLLTAAHHAPSVGFMQPWRFVRVASSALRSQLQAMVEQERVQTARVLGQREDEFMRLKVEACWMPLKSGQWPWPMGAKSTFLGGAPCRRWTWPRPPVRFKTCGWPHGPKGWAWGGSHCSTLWQWPPCCNCPRGPTRSTFCA